MDRYRYFILNQKRVLVLGVLQVACAALCVICGFMDAVFRKDTPLSTTRTPVWAGMIMACPGVLALFASQRRNSILKQECQNHRHDHFLDYFLQTFVLHRMVKGANATMLLSCFISLLLSSLIAYVGCCSLPRCGCYDARTGLETLIPQCDPGDAEMVCTWQAGGDDRLFNSPAQPTDCGTTEQEGSSKLPPYSRLT
ncbi:uncharacterized protein zgc:113425 isoform X3 [Phyllopteryx taeniolatus]|uniref:uncharacterized protein zgc:113425 isoform X3 n=1 Tax=Phyllopteryx taeniolatus TaxID=161469 RepID=UPI002AD1FBA6|nr:uncharacterized protein zgc:113425 isoform X3 [Phyllopteryx taeniolatus]